MKDSTRRMPYRKPRAPVETLLDHGNLRIAISDAALKWFRANQEFLAKSGRNEPACYDLVGDALRDLIEACRRADEATRKVTT